MLSGRETLQHLDTNLRKARNRLEHLDRSLQDQSELLARNRQQQARAVKQLAEIRLDAIRRGDVTQRIDAADREVEATLERRRKAIDALNESIRRTTEELQRLEERRSEIHDTVDEAAQRLAESEAAVQQQLENDDAFIAQLKKSRGADAIAVSATEKASVAADDRREKGAPYESDELFMYLWKRGYGTSEYRANPLARLLDAWVARLCKFREARSNYWMLLEIPTRLRAHAERKREQANVELDKLQAIEERAAAAGGVPEAKAALQEAEARQDAIDKQIAEAEAHRQSLGEEQNRYSAGDDDYMNQCLDALSRSLASRDVNELTRLAMATMTIEDDTVVDALRRLRRDDNEIRSELTHNRDLHREHLRRVRELEEVRQRFKRHRYDDVRSEFRKGEQIVDMIGEVLGGAIRSGALWDVLRRYQRYRDVGGAWPDFGSGSIRRSGRRAPARRSTWHWPGPSGSSRRGGFKLPRSTGGGSRSRGGFRTGGGF